jgi:hypothetical protein
MKGFVASMEQKRGKFHIKVSLESKSENSESNIVCAMFLEAQNMLRATGYEARRDVSEEM